MSLQKIIEKSVVSVSVIKHTPWLLALLLTHDILLYIHTQGLTNLLCKSSKMLQLYIDLWAPLLQHTIALIECSPEESMSENLNEEEKQTEYQGTFVKLVYSGGRDNHDTFSNIKDTTMYLASSIQELSSTLPSGSMNTYVSRIDDKYRKHLFNYLQQSNIVLK